MENSLRKRPVLAGLGVVAVLALGWWAVSKSTSTPGGSALAAVEGRVALADGQGPAPADATVVVFAYAVDGPQVPLAVWRRPATALPLDFRLDDGLAPDAKVRLSQVKQLIVGARMGPGGEPLAQVGDWVAGSQTVAVAPGAPPVQLKLQPPPK